MSVKAMGRVWDLDIPHNKRLVLLAMADHADHEGRNIYPSTDLIAWKTGYSFRQVQRVIDALIEDGVLVVIKPSRQQHPATYALNLTAGTIKPPFDRVARKAQSRQNVTSQNGHNVISESRQNVTPPQSRDDILPDPGMTFEAPRDDTAMSSKPWEPSMNHDDDDDDGRTLAFLESEGIGAAKEFAHLPYESMRLDYQNRRDEHQDKPIIVRAWRRKPPTESYHYERPDRPDDAPDQRGRYARSEKRPRGSHNPTGGAELRDPGWMDREIAAAEARARSEL